MADALSRDEIDALLRGMADGAVTVDAEASARDVAQPVSLIPERDENPGRRFPGARRWCTSASCASSAGRSARCSTAA